MRLIRCISVSVAAVSLLALAGVSGAQPPTREEPTPVPTEPGAPSPPPPPQPAEPTPARPTPVPAAPAGPGVPTPPPAAKEEEPQPPPRPGPIAEPQRVPEELLPSREPTRFAPGVFVGPDLFNPPAPQGWLTLTPSFTLSAAYDDNIFLSSRDRRSDVIFGFTPGGTLAVRRPGFRLLAGYNISGQLFVKESDLSDFGKEQQFFADLFYQVSPRVTFTLSDQFLFARDSNAITSGGVSVGRRDAWRNTLTPQLRWQATESTGFSLVASHTIIRFQGGGDTSQTDGERDSDTYRVLLGTDRRLTARLTGMLNAEVAYFDIKGESSAVTYTPTVGIAYDITPTLRASVSGGPSIVERDGKTTLSPRLNAALNQTFKFGSLQAGYSRSIAAETNGLSDAQFFFASLVVPTLTRGLRLEFTPRYTIVDSDVSGSNGNTDSETVKTLTLTVRATYQIARNISLIGSYTFFQQTTTSRGVGDIDQNRAFLGVQYAFPINFY